MIRLLPCVLLIGCGVGVMPDAGVDAGASFEDAVDAGPVDAGISIPDPGTRASDQTWLTVAASYFDEPSPLRVSGFRE